MYLMLRIWLDNRASFLLLYLKLKLPAWDSRVSPHAKLTVRVRFSFLILRLEGSPILLPATRLCWELFLLLVLHRKEVLLVSLDLLELTCELMPFEFIFAFRLLVLLYWLSLYLPFLAYRRSQWASLIILVFKWHLADLLSMKETCLLLLDIYPRIFAPFGDLLQTAFAS